MKVLTFHGARSPIHVPPLPLCDGHTSTNLEELHLIDCFISAECLHQVLGFPRALKRLTLASDSAHQPVFHPTELNPEEYFDAISKTSAAESLEGLRLDLNYFRRALVPAPGMHKLIGVRYLELAVHHLDLDVGNSMNNLTNLLPPNLEVLKISPNANDVPGIYNVLLRREELVPSLKRVVISSLYRNKRHAKNLVKKYKTKSPRIPLDELPKNFPEVRRQKFHRLTAACAQAGVDLRILYEDTARWAIFEEGRGPPLWELPDQIF